MSIWQPIETAPRYGTRVLVYDRIYGTVIGQWSFSEWYIHELRATCHPTHWQPLPPPPEGAQA